MVVKLLLKVEGGTTSCVVVVDDDANNNDIWEQCLLVPPSVRLDVAVDVAEGS